MHMNKFMRPSRAQSCPHGIFHLHHRPLHCHPIHARSGQALSAAQGLSRWAESGFAALGMTVLSLIRMPGSICSCALPRPPPLDRPALHIPLLDYFVNVHHWPLHCHPERSAGSVALTPAVSESVSFCDTVTLSAAKGLSRWAASCFAALSMTVLSPLRMSGLFC